MSNLSSLGSGDSQSSSLGGLGVGPSTHMTTSVPAVGTMLVTDVMRMMEEQNKRHDALLQTLIAKNGSSSSSSSTTDDSDFQATRRYLKQLKPCPRVKREASKWMAFFELCNQRGIDIEKDPAVKSMIEELKRNFTAEATSSTPGGKSQWKSFHTQYENAVYNINPRLASLLAIEEDEEQKPAAARNKAGKNYNRSHRNDDDEYSPPPKSFRYESSYNNRSRYNNRANPRQIDFDSRSQSSNSSSSSLSNSWYDDRSSASYTPRGGTANGRSYSNPPPSSVAGGHSHT